MKITTSSSQIPERLPRQDWEQRHPGLAAMFRSALLFLVLATFEHTPEYWVEGGSTDGPERMGTLISSATC